MKRVLYHAALLLLILPLMPSCHQTDPPPDPTPGSVTNDISGAIGGLQVAVEADPPVTPAQALCDVLVGVWTGLSASGYFGNNRQGWPGSSYNVDLNAVTLKAKSYYAAGADDYSSFGEIHNQALDAWAKSSHRSSFGDNDETKAFVGSFFDNNSLVSSRAATCAGSRMSRYTPPSDNLTKIGVGDAILSLDDIADVDSYFDGMITKYPTFTDALKVFRDITKTAWSYSDAKQTDALDAYIKDQLAKVNSNYYHFDMNNFAAGVAMINIFVHSWCYWSAYYGSK